VALVPEDVEALSMKAEAYTRVKPKDWPGYAGPGFCFTRGHVHKGVDSTQWKMHGDDEDA
jgi:hypothetical protein